MSFEKVVIAKVANVLKVDNAASFFNGSLSVVCNQKDAKKVLRTLTKDYNNKVQMTEHSRGYGFIYDFIA